MELTLWVFVLSFGVVLLVALLITLVVGRSMLGARVGTRQTVLAAPFLLGFALVMLLLYLALPEAWHGSAWIAFQLGVPVLAGEVEMVALWRRKRASSVLLDLGHIPGHVISLIAGGVWIILAIADIIFNVAATSVRFETWAEAFFHVSLGILFISNGLQKVQLREGGFLYQQLIPWSKTRGYKWEEDNRNTLTLSVRTSFPLLDECSFLIPAACRDEVDRLLPQYVPCSSTLNCDQTAL